MFNVGIIGATPANQVTVMLPASFNLQRFGTGYYHGIELTAGGALLVTGPTSGPNPTTPLGSDYWVKSSDRVPGAGAGFDVRFSAITGAAYPYEQPVTNFSYSLGVDNTFRWKWTGSPGGQCTMSILNAGTSVVVASTTIYIA